MGERELEDEESNTVPVFGVAQRTHEA